MPAGIQAEISAAIQTFRFNEGELRRLLTGPAGPVVRDLSRRAIRVEASAKQHASGRPGPNVITGRLRGGITWRLGVDERGPYADVGEAVLYAPYVERLYPYLVPALEAARAP